MNHLESVGLGLARTKLQFVAQVKRHPYAYGFTTGDLYSFQAFKHGRTKEVHRGGQSHDLSLINRSQIGGEPMWRILELLEPYHSLMGMSDIINIKKIYWLKENPIPKVSYRDDGGNDGHGRLGRIGRSSYTGLKRGTHTTIP